MTPSKKKTAAAPSDPSASDGAKALAKIIRGMGDEGKKLLTMSQSELDRATLGIKVVSARERLLDFMQVTWRTPSQPLLVGRHTREIAARLDRAVSDLERGISTYLIIVVPFRHGKSDLVSRFFPPYVLGRNKDLEFILATYGGDLSEDLSRDARSIMQSAEYSLVFPGVIIDKNTNAANRWGVHRARGGMRAVGLGGAATGRGADVMIIDDPIKGREEAEQEDQRRKAWDSIRSDFLTRLAPVHIVVLMATRWHVDDPIGRAMDAMRLQDNFPKFEVMHYRARQDDGSFLFPERFGDDWYDRQFAMLGSYSASALLQGDPVVRGGNMLKIDNVKLLDEWPGGLMWCRYWDLASTRKELAKDDPDWTCGVKIAVTQSDGVSMVYIDDVRWVQAEAGVRDRMIRDTAGTDGPGVWQGVEAVAGYKDAATTLKRVLAGTSVVHGIRVSKDKVIRASEMEPLFEAGNVFIKRGAWWQNRFLKELGEFPSGKHDDAVDAMTGAYNMALDRWVRHGKFGGVLSRGAVYGQG